MSGLECLTACNVTFQLLPALTETDKSHNQDQFPSRACLCQENQQTRHPSPSAHTGPRGDEAGWSVKRPFSDGVWKATAFPACCQRPGFEGITSKGNPERQPERACVHRVHRHCFLSGGPGVSPAPPHWTGLSSGAGRRGS